VVEGGGLWLRWFVVVVVVEMYLKNDY
jgi:hypothetical protein